MNIKTMITMAILLVGSVQLSRACDICGCGVGSYYLGILPDFNKRFVGLRYQHKLLTTHLGPMGNRTPISADEAYESLEWWGAWNFGTRWRAMAILPYNFNTRHVRGSGQTGYKNGVGDLALMGFYKVFEQVGGTGDNKLLIHSLWAGIGVKAPTGKYDEGERASVSQDAPNNFQLGTASTDFMVNLAYDIRLMDLGLNTNVSYKVNTENRHEYRYGNKLTANALLYYKFNIKNRVRIAPNAGVMYETQTKDVIYGRYDVAQSGGNSLTGVAGVEVNAGRVSFGGNYQAPLSQDLADGRAKAGDRWLAHVSFSF
ncbi:transporter [Parapedobacter indicus]|uniref:MetA-pathway of phenol degradation n=1 Tax=Parapedobacter indicus TaxID=1477437 RepID=A0A1I3NNJ8_9SPHI|nr:transporter [Parapedobacter indicus]PPL01028.1 hypothetical protein CLV26_107249 [Parapedobacter indicus]SFJ10336.1 hypothetical protein SAMN05444682_107249 [Parapedobacter indicus]